MDEAEYEGVKFQKGVFPAVGSGGQLGWAKDQYSFARPLEKLVGQINGVADKSFINCVNCASEYDLTERNCVPE